ncbi:Chaperone protein DnaJ [Streptomyces microflavus]
MTGHGTGLLRSAGSVADRKPGRDPAGLPQARPEHHPDVNKDPSAEERFKDLNEAHSVLSDPKTRDAYDRFGEDFRKIPEDYDERVAAGAGGGFRTRRTTGAGGPRARYTTGFGEDFSAEDVNIEDLLGSLFGAGASSAGVPGADQEAELPLTVEEAHKGRRRTVTLTGPSGEPRRYEVEVPPGVTDGQRIRLAGKAGGAVVPHPQATCTFGCASGPIPSSDWTTAMSMCRSRSPRGGGPGRDRAGAHPRRWWYGQAHCSPARPAAVGCGCAAKGTPNPGVVRAATCTPNSASWCRPPWVSGERELFEELAATSSFDPRRTR